MLLDNAERRSPVLALTVPTGFAGLANLVADWEPAI